MACLFSYGIFINQISLVWRTKYTVYNLSMTEHGWWIYTQANLASEDVYMKNFIQRWNSARNEPIPVYDEVSLTIYKFLPEWNFAV